MSQIYKASNSGSVPTDVPIDFVTDSGTAVAVNNILNVITTDAGTDGITTTGSGNTITIVPNVVFNTPITATIDFTKTGTTTLYTPPSGKNFAVNSVVIIFETITGETIDGAWNIGTNSPNFDNIVMNITFQQTASGTYLLYVPSPSLTNSPFATSATPIVFNITQGKTATTANGKVFLTGSLF